MGGYSQNTLPLTALEANPAIVARKELFLGKEFL